MQTSPSGVPRKIERRRHLTEPPGRVGPARAARVLVVEDEADVAELIRYNVAKEGYDVVVARNGADGLRLAREGRPDVILLDIMVPQLNGWELCRLLKRDPLTHEVPVIILTGRVEEADKVLGFEMGADDYVTKPFSPRELVARIRAVTRRGKAGDARDKGTRLRAGELEINRERFEVRLRGRAAQDGFVEPRTVDVHFARLCAKFATAQLEPPAIETVRGIGYRLRDDTP